MAADDKILEALARLEHKVDLLLQIDIIRNIKNQVSLAPVGGDHNCPVCTQRVEYQVDISEGVVLRKCGCKTGKIALNMGAFAPPAPTQKKDQDDEQRTEQEDRRNPTPRGGPTRRR